MGGALGDGFLETFKGLFRIGSDVDMGESEPQGLRDIRGVSCHLRGVFYGPITVDEMYDSNANSAETDICVLEAAYAQSSMWISHQIMARVISKGFSRYVFLKSLPSLNGFTRNANRTASIKVGGRVAVDFGPGRFLETPLETHRVWLCAGGIIDVECVVEVNIEGEVLNVRTEIVEA